MGFKFYTVYRVTRRGMGCSFIALGVRELRIGGGPNEEGKEGFAFLVPGSALGGRGIEGRLIEDRDDRLVVEDSRKRHRNGRPYRWIFERLTVKIFAEMKGDITLWGRVAAQCPTDELLQMYYREDWLAEYWEEIWKTGKDVP